jgi:HK97 family phage portal protein
MNIVQDLKNEINSTTNTFVSLSNPTNYSRVSNDDIVKKGFLSNEDVFSIVSRMARLCASLPLDIYNGDEVVGKGDEFYDFFTSAWGKAGYKEGLNAAFINLFLFGNSYIYEETESIGFLPTNQWVLPSQKVRTDAGYIDYFKQPEYYQFDTGVRTKTIYADEMTVIKYYDPTYLHNSTEGLSPLQATFNTVLAANNRTEAEKSMLDNRGISGFVSPKAGAGASFGLSTKAIEYARQIFNKLTGKATNFNKVEVIEDAVEFTQLGLSASDLKIIEMRLNHVRSICNAYGVPSLLFNDYQSRTHANYKEAKSAMYLDFVIPQFELFYNQYENSIIKRFNESTGGEYRIEIRKDKIGAINPDPSELRKEAITQYQVGLINKKEARELIGRMGEMEEDEQTAMDLILRSPSLAGQAFSIMSEEEKRAFLKQLGFEL